MGLNDIRFYISLFIRRLPLFAAIALSNSVVGIVIVFKLPAIYRSSATILVASPQISAELAPSTVPNRAVEQISAYQQEIMTRDHLAVTPEISFDRRGHVTAMLFSLLLLPFRGQLLWVSSIGFP